MKVTFTFDDTAPEIVAVFGADVGIKLSDIKGYTEQVHNPDYVPAVGAETIDDTSKEAIVDELGIPIYPQIPNPDHVPAVGEPTMQNPDTRAVHLGKKLRNEAAVPYLVKELEATTLKSAQDQIEQMKGVIESNVEITTE